MFSDSNFCFKMLPTSSFPITVDKKTFTPSLESATEAFAAFPPMLTYTELDLYFSAYFGKSDTVCIKSKADKPCTKIFLKPITLKI